MFFKWDNTATEVSEIIDESGVRDPLDATKGSQNVSPKSLQDIVLAVIAQDPLLSEMLVQSKSFEDSHLHEVLTKITPFIQLLPLEIKCELLTFLPIQDWKALFKVSTKWKQAVMTAATLFLNEVARDKATVISLDDFERILKNLLENVVSYYRITYRRPAQVCELKQLEKEVHSLTQPLAKLFYCQKRLAEMQLAIEREYENVMPFFSSPRNSKLYNVLESARKQCQNILESSWFKKVQFCVSLCPDHVIAKHVADAFLEIKGQKDGVEEKAPVLTRVEGSTFGS